MIVFEFVYSRQDLDGDDLVTVGRIRKREKIFLCYKFKDQPEDDNWNAINDGEQNYIKNEKG